MDRRTLIKSASAGAFAHAALALRAEPTLAKSSPPTRVPFDPTDIEASTQAFLKLVGSQGKETVRRWFTGKVYAYFPGEPVQELFYSDGFYLGDFWPEPDGTHRSRLFEITFKRDIRTGKLLERWKNPFTGRVDEVMDSVGGPQDRVYNAWGWDNPKKPRGPDNPRELDWTIIDDTAWLTWDAMLRFKNPLPVADFPLASSGDYLNLVNLTNYYGRLSDIENPQVLNAPGTLFWAAITGWQPWMRMGQRPGALIYKSVGVKVASFDKLPKPVFEAGEARFPGCLTEKVDWPEGNYMWFDYADKEWPG